jgi:hypothetical protein
LTNPRIVPGKRDGKVAFSVRGRALGATFLIAVRRTDIEGLDRAGFEDRLIEEARSLIREAESSPTFDWAGKGFSARKGFETWEKTLSAADVRRLTEA